MKTIASAHAAVLHSGLLVGSSVVAILGAGFAIAQPPADYITFDFLFAQNPPPENTPPSEGSPPATLSPAPAPPAGASPVVPPAIVPPPVAVPPAASPSSAPSAAPPSQASPRATPVPPAQAPTEGTEIPQINVNAPRTAPARVAAPPSPAQPAAVPAPVTPIPPPQQQQALQQPEAPANTQVITSGDLSHTRSPNLLDSLTRSLPGVSLSDQTGNQFQRDLNFRGFTASPVQGTPQGLAVYQNGVRINEVFGDTVNWDFIPDVAVHSLSLVPNNPIFGLNALGGAASVEMKNGFTYQGKEAEVLGGSFGRIQGSVQEGFRDGNIAGFVSADALNDRGWREFSSSSKLRRLYADFGVRGDQTEFHLTFTGADNHLGGVAATPVEMLSRNWSSVYSWPQTTRNQLAFVTGTASYEPSEVLSTRIFVASGNRMSMATTRRRSFVTPDRRCFVSETP
jgi:iron complex outermembrane receptor protein